jgi:hypothetical protein
LNSRFMMTQAQALAGKVSSVEEAWRRVLGRDPSPEERTAAAEFVGRRGIAELARALMNLNEFLYVD